MGDIRYVCLSDLHFGSETSILTALRPGTVEVDPSGESPALVGLVDCLRALVRANEDPAPATLILLGDVLELALGDDGVAMTSFSRFVELAFAAGERIFADTVYFVPGNHDHHQWEAAREQLFAQYLSTLAPGAPVATPWHASRCFLDAAVPPVEAAVLTALFRRFPQCAGVTVRAVYPNLALGSPDGSRSVLLHHGHLVEPLYTLMSEVDSLVFPGRVRPAEVWELEEENYAWIDFLWSTLGQTGPVGDDVTRVYDMLQSGPAASALAHRIASRLAARTSSAFLRPLFRFVLGIVLGEVASRAVTMERLSTTGPYSPAAQASLTSYLEGPMLLQWQRESGMARPSAFVFGHTHKPMTETAVAPAGWPAPFDVYNTGGWVVDTLEPQPDRGASVVVVDGVLDVAAIAMYREETEAAAYRVRVEAAGASPLAERLSALVDPTVPPWSTFSAAAAAVVPVRKATLARIIAVAGAASR